MNYQIDYQQIIDYILRRENIQLEEIRKKERGKSRKRELVFIRQLCMYFARKKTKASLSQVGTYMSRDHATVLHAIKTINNLIDTDRMIKYEINKWDAMINLGLKYNFMKVQITVPIYELTEIGQTTISIPEGSEKNSVLCLNSTLIGSDIATVDQQNGYTVIYMKQPGTRSKIVV